MAFNKYDRQNRTSVNVSKEFRDKLQKLSCLYTVKYNKQISLGDMLDIILKSLSDACLHDSIAELVTLLHEDQR